MSFFEIKQDEIHDLLHPGQNLQIRSTEDQNVFVENLVDVTVQSYEEAIEIVNAGLEQKHKL